jgi:hypothetical protein
MTQSQKLIGYKFWIEVATSIVTLVWSMKNQESNITWLVCFYLLFSIINFTALVNVVG